MHAHLEIILPPTKNVKRAVEQIMSEFSEEDKDNKHSFYDFYTIGGRFSGEKLIAELGREGVNDFSKLLLKKKFTLNAVVAGKEDLTPSSQIEEVDKLWNEFFPNAPVKVCPLFRHYKESYGDVCELSKIPKELEAFRVIIARHPFLEGGEIGTNFMLTSEVWNGVNFQNTTWKGNVQEALSLYEEHISGYAKEFKEKNTPKDNWLCVTVDYHS